MSSANHPYLSMLYLREFSQPSVFRDMIKINVKILFWLSHSFIVLIITHYNQYNNFRPFPLINLYLLLALNRKNFCCPILVFCFYFFFCCVNEIVLWNRPDVDLLSLHCKPVKTEAKFQNSWKPGRQKNIFWGRFKGDHTVIIEGTIGEKLVFTFILQISMRKPCI